MEDVSNPMSLLDCFLRSDFEVVDDVSIGRSEKELLNQKSIHPILVACMKSEIYPADELTILGPDAWGNPRYFLKDKNWDGFVLLPDGTTYRLFGDGELLSFGPDGRYSPGQGSDDIMYPKVKIPQTMLECYAGIEISNDCECEDFSPAEIEQTRQRVTFSDLGLCFRQGLIPSEEVTSIGIDVWGGTRLLLVDINRDAKVVLPNGAVYNLGGHPAIILSYGPDGEFSEKENSDDVTFSIFGTYESTLLTSHLLQKYPVKSFGPNPFKKVRRPKSENR